VYYLKHTINYHLHWLEFRILAL